MNPEGKAAASGPLPFLSAMLIADLAIREEGTGKASLIGIFENVNAQSFPYRHNSLVVYAKMTDAEGPYDFTLELIRLEEATKIAEATVSAKAPDRMGVGELVLSLTNLVLPAPGLYEFRLLANGRHVGSKTFRVIQSKPLGG